MSRRFSIGWVFISTYSTHSIIMHDILNNRGKDGHEQAKYFFLCTNDNKKFKINFNKQKIKKKKRINMSVLQIFVF